MLPVLRDELLTLKASVRRTDPNALVFGTGRGNRQNASNIRNRILAPAVKHANEWLGDAGEVPLPDGLTPHKLRHLVDGGVMRPSGLFGLVRALPVVILSA
jgi:integrase